MIVSAFSRKDFLFQFQGNSTTMSPFPMTIPYNARNVVCGILGKTFLSCGGTTTLFSKNPVDEMKAHVLDDCYTWTPDTKIWKKQEKKLPQKYLAPSTVSAKGANGETILIIGK